MVTLNDRKYITEVELLFWSYEMGERVRGRGGGERERRRRGERERERECKQSQG